jgi:hypothetical protein
MRAHDDAPMWRCRECRKLLVLLVGVLVASAILATWDLVEWAQVDWRTLLLGPVIR